MVGCVSTRSCIVLLAKAGGVGPSSDQDIDDLASTATMIANARNDMHMYSDSPVPCTFDPENAKAPEAPETSSQ